ncbi:MAG TPA: hypothetical protein VLB47_03615, partial [Solirubrobacteraceae bacterium]|nr:hypothetical protein [Solirubrobacteraceae bacterium]
LLAGFIVAGAGIGTTNPSLATTAVSVVDPRRSGMASGINNTFRQVGIATGTAAYGALFQHLLQSRVGQAFAGGPGATLARRLPVEAYAQGSPGPLGRVPGGAHAYLGAFTASLNALLLVAAGVAAAGAVASLALIRGSDLEAARAPASAQAAEPAFARVRGGG